MSAKTSKKNGRPSTNTKASSPAKKRKPVPQKSVARNANGSHLSKCCGAGVLVGGERTTHLYICRYCLKPCDCE